jgi:hypothetical protein
MEPIEDSPIVAGCLQIYPSCASELGREGICRAFWSVSRPPRNFQVYFSSLKGVGKNLDFDGTSIQLQC